MISKEGVKYMSEFMIELPNIRSDAEEIKHLSSQLNSCTDRIRNITGRTSFSDVVMLIIKCRLYDICTSTSNQSNRLNHMSSSLNNISSLYQRTESTIVNSNSLFNTKIGDQAIFQNESKGYGGNQGNLANNHNGVKLFFGWVWFEDKDIYNFVKQQEGYENYSEAQIHDLLNQMNKEGCGYIGIVNAIFSEFEGSEEEFEARFGFPMRDSEGNYNYNKMFIELYCQTDNKYYLGESGGVTALAIETVYSYGNNQEDFKNKYGVDLGSYDENGNFNYSDDAFFAVINDINTNYDSDAVVTFDSSRDGLTVSAQENHIMAYLKAHGMESSAISYEKTERIMSSSELQSNLDEGKVTSVLLNSGTEMYNDAGKTSTLDGGHYVTVTGITEDGRYIVSSWGKKYYIDPNQAEILSYQMINISF